MPILLDAGPSGRGWHRLELVLQCPQKYAWTYRNVPTDDRPGSVQKAGTAPALVKGSLFHIAMAHHYARAREAQHGRDPDAYYTPEVALKMLAEKFSAKGDHVAFDFVPEIQSVLNAYRQKYLFESFKVLHVEEVFEGIIADYPITGRYDLVVREADGKVWIWDHKTTFKIDHNTAMGYAMSGQFLAAQTIGRRVWGEDFGGIKLNMVGMTSPFKFERVIIPPAPNALQTFPETVREAEERISRFSLLPADAWPKVASESVCIHRYGQCAFFEKCRWGEK